MSPVISVANPGQRRNQLRRTIAEMLRQLMMKRQLDDEAKDMAAAMVFALRGIAETIEEATVAWEKRNYFLKADRFRLEWEWVLPASQRLARLIAAERWEQLPQELANLAPHFADVHVTKMTRSATAWQGSYQLLLREQ